MLKRLLILLFSALFFSQIAYAGIYENSKDREMRKIVVNLVNNAAKLVKKEGRIRAVCAFNAENRRVKKGYPYLFAFVCNDGKNDSIVLANKNFDFVFTSFYSHPNHIKFRKMLAEHPSGVWVHYNAKNADTGKVEEKKSYLVMLPKYKICIGAGYFPVAK